MFTSAADAQAKCGHRQSAANVVRLPRTLGKNLCPVDPSPEAGAFIVIVVDVASLVEHQVSVMKFTTSFSVSFVDNCFYTSNEDVLTVL